MLQSISGILAIKKLCSCPVRYRSKGAICGIAVNLTVGVRNLAGGEIKEYVLMFNDDRNPPMERLSV